MYSTMSSASNDNFTSFPIWIFFSFLIPVVRTSKTMLSNSGESGHPCLIPDLRENGFSFSPLRVMFAVGLVVYGLYYVEVGFLCVHFLDSFHHKWLWILSKAFFCIY